MAAGTVQVPPDSTGKILDTSELIVGANTVERENVVSADPTDASGLAKVKNAAPGATDYGLVTRNIPSGTQTVDGSGVTQPVSGTFFQATQPVSAASLPLPTGAAADATLTGGTQKAITRGGAKGATAAADLTSTAEGADHQALDIQVYHGGVAKDPTAIRALTSTDVVTTAPPANASANVAQLAGTATSVNSGTKDAGTLRVVLATDQPALTNKLLVTPDSVALPANQSVNAAQLAGTATSVNSGTKDAGTLRVVLATDQPALTNKLLVTPDSVALPANQSVNAAQFGGTNVVTGTGASAAGVPRVTVSNDSSLAANQSVNVNQVGGANVVTSIAGAPAVGGDTANAATDAGNPVKTGGKALTNYSIPATVTTGQRVNAWYDLTGAQIVKLKSAISYSAAYRLIDSTAGQLSLTFTFGLNTNKQLATIYHAAGATKTVRIRKVSVVLATGALGIFNLELRALSAATAPATGNPAITPRTHDPTDGAAEATCLALPTTAGSLVGADTGTVGLPFEWNSAGAAAVANPSGLAGQEIVLFQQDEARGIKPLTMRAANAEGYAVNGRCTTAVALRFLVLIEFTEE